MVQVKQLSFANIKTRQKGSQKLSWITILAWHDMHKVTASSLCFQSICKNYFKIVLNDYQISTKTIWLFPPWFACVIVKKLIILLFNKENYFKPISVFSYIRLFSNSFYYKLFGTHQHLLDQMQIFIGWCADLRDRREKKQKEKVSYGPILAIIFCKHQN